MKLKRWSSLLLVLSLVLTVLTGPALAAGDGSAAAEAAAQLGATTSLQYAVWQKGEIVLSGHTGTYSKTENRALASTDLYGVGSVSKVYTAAAVMKLVDAGKIDLDKPVTTYLPTFKMADARYKDITVRMLLNHASGLPGGVGTGNAFLFDDAGEKSATDTLLQKLETQRLKADPGAYSVYCNDGFTMAELVVEAVSGMDFETYLQKEIFAPLGLKNTFTPADEFDRTRLAKCYASAEDTRALPDETLGIVGTGGIYATAEDLAAFGGALYAGDLLTQKSLDAMGAAEYANGIWPEDTENLLSYGLGWDAVEFYPFAYSNVQALVKGGDTLYYHAGLLVIPEYELSVSVLSSGGVSTYNEAAAARIAADLLKSQGVTLDESARSFPAAAKADMPKELLDLAGYYGTTGQIVKVGLTADGILSITSPAYLDDPGQVLTYRGDGFFQDEENIVQVKLVTEENGEVYLWQKSYADLPGLVSLPAGGYTAIRLAENTISPEDAAVWTQRTQSIYLALEEKYTSQLYAMILAGTGLPLSTEPAGYLNTGHKLVDADSAQPSLSVPGNIGRDWMDMHFAQKDGVGYANIGGSLYLDAMSTNPIYPGKGVCTIQPDGYARWYQTGASAGKTMTVTVPENGAFYVYNAMGATVAGSLAFGDTSVVLPEGGWLVFAGDPGAQFQLQIG